MSATVELKREQSIETAVADTAERTEFYERASHHGLAPLWKVLGGLVTATPQPKAVPFRWRYSDVRPFLMESCDLVSTAEAERRVMVFENPALPGQSRVADSLFAGFQIIRPGEIAPAHRHAASALRFIVEGKDAYSAVNGERTMMLPGDFVITPSWVWHDHGNIGTEPMVWLDGLDMHIVNMLNASFREEMHNQRHELTRPDDSTRVEYGYAMAPSVRPAHPETVSPILNYPYVRADEMLKSMSAHTAPDPWRGHMLDYLNPLTGSWAMPTLATSMRRLPAGFSTKPYRSTDTTVLIVVEGEGTSRIGDEEFDWGPHDLMVVPSWKVQQHQANTTATLFSYSDRAVQDKLNLWREDRLDQ